MKVLTNLVFQKRGNNMFNICLYRILKVVVQVFLKSIFVFILNVFSSFVFFVFLAGWPSYFLFLSIFYKEINRPTMLNHWKRFLVNMTFWQKWSKFTTKLWLWKYLFLSSCMRKNAERIWTKRQTSDRDDGVIVYIVLYCNLLRLEAERQEKDHFLPSNLFLWYHLFFYQWSFMLLFPYLSSFRKQLFSNHILNTLQLSRNYLKRHSNSFQLWRQQVGPQM